MGIFKGRSEVGWEGRDFLLLSVYHILPLFWLTQPTLSLFLPDVVAVYLPNTPQIFFSFWALAKLNAVGALINSNQTGVPLTHSISISKANLIVAHATNYQPIRDIEHELPHANIAILSYDELVPEKCPYQAYDMKDFRRTGKSDEIRRTLKVETGDSLCYIYTR
jgi:acyl-CoA synthetase (AMP-forming)/AMP-acid ligase II